MARAIINNPLGSVKFLQVPRSQQVSEATAQRHVTSQPTSSRITTVTHCSHLLTCTHALAPSSRLPTATSTAAQPHNITSQQTPSPCKRLGVSCQRWNPYSPSGTPFSHCTTLQPLSLHLFYFFLIFLFTGIRQFLEVMATRP